MKKYSLFFYLFLLGCVLHAQDKAKIGLSFNWDNCVISVKDDKGILHGNPIDPFSMVYLGYACSDIDSINPKVSFGFDRNKKLFEFRFKDENVINENFLLHLQEVPDSSVCTLHPDEVVTEEGIRIFPWYDDPNILVFASPISPWVRMYQPDDWAWYQSAEDFLRALRNRVRYQQENSPYPPAGGISVDWGVEVTEIKLCVHSSVIADDIMKDEKGMNIQQNEDGSFQARIYKFSNPKRSKRTLP